MANKPALIAVDDDPEVLAAVERDLRSRYSQKYRVVRTASAQAALEMAESLSSRGDSVAAVISDQRMPGMTGTELLERVREAYPRAKRVLLTAYSDTEAAIQAINTARIDYYLSKPWDPPDHSLYPVLDDLLADWEAGYRAPFEGVRVIGLRWSLPTHELKSFLGRHQVPFEWIEPEHPEAKRTLEKEGMEECPLPVLVLPDGERMIQPSTAELAERLGLQTKAKMPFYDLAIVGGGPAGLAAAVYGASEGLTTVLIEREAPGGQAGQSSLIENYLGFPSGLSGQDLARRAQAQAARFGVEILNTQEATELCLQDGFKVLTLSDGSRVSARALVISTGVQYRKLDAPGVHDLTGRGVYYGAAITEAITCRDEEIFIVGGANSAGQAAVFLAGYARQVTLLVRGSSLDATMSKYLIDEIERMPNVGVRTRIEVKGAQGVERLEALILQDAVSGKEETCPAGALFIFIGAVPRTDWLGGLLTRDKNGFLLSGPDLVRQNGKIENWPLSREPYLLESNVPGVFVAGDVRSGSIKRIASSVGDGSVAIQLVHRFLGEAVN